jgi:hypothetical protein
MAHKSMLAMMLFGVIQNGVLEFNGMRKPLCQRWPDSIEARLKMRYATGFWSGLNHFWEVLCYEKVKI